MDLKSDEMFSAALEGIPKVVDLIATVPEAKRTLALAAAQRSYLQTAQTLGYDESDARDWASAIMLQLQEMTFLATERNSQLFAATM